MSLSLVGETMVDARGNMCSLAFLEALKKHFFCSWKRKTQALDNHRISNNVQNSTNLAFSCSVHLFSGLHILREINHPVLSVLNV